MKREALEVLVDLIKNNFTLTDEGLIWKWHEDTSLGVVNPELEEEILELLETRKKSKVIKEYINRSKYITIPEIIEAEWKLAIQDEAKELSLEIWSYLHDHPEIESKRRLPLWLFDKIRDKQNDCPLCSLFNPQARLSSNDETKCGDCPLNKRYSKVEGENPTHGCYSPKSPFQIWSEQKYKPNEVRARQIRQQKAGEIVELIERWNP